MRVVIIGLLMALAACSSTESAQNRARRFHVVRPGESVESVATRYGVKPEHLMLANRIREPASLASGSRLYIPYDLERIANDPSMSEQIEDSVDSLELPVSLRLPLKRETKVTSFFGWRNKRLHDGIDLKGAVGDEIVAAADGRVISASRVKGYGRVVMLQHDGDWTTVYAHCSKLLVKHGQQVKAGQKIATVGRTGRSTGPHLHFEVRKGADPVDPLIFLFAGQGEGDRSRSRVR